MIVGFPPIWAIAAVVVLLCAAAAPAAGACPKAPHHAAGPGQSPTVPAHLTVPPGFTIATIAAIDGARELAALPNGDLLVGSKGRNVYVVPAAEATSPGRPELFAQLPDDLAAGVAFSARRCEIFIGTERGVYATAYANGQRSAGSLRRIAAVRTGSVAPHGDGDVHSTTSVAFDDRDDRLYVAVGSSCNACTEVDPTRASIFEMNPDGGNRVKRAMRIRNAIALAIDPARNELWAGDAGQDDLPFGHPYEFLDDVTAHSGAADYGWPECEENRIPYVPGADCAKTVAPLAVLPAYSTVIGAAFYPAGARGPHAFPSLYGGALFAAAHGSWHTTPNGTTYAAVPQVVVFAMRGGRPAIAVDWHDPHLQWRTFIGGFQQTERDRSGRPTGIAVGAAGSLFVADDAAGAVYRIRPR